MLGIIMAGGQGTRLMPLTQTRPKPMVEVLGRPVIDYVKDAMVEAGIFFGLLLRAKRFFMKQVACMKREIGQMRPADSLTLVF